MANHVCNNCESPHFNVRWDDNALSWQVCCEGCGDIYQLNPIGYVELLRAGVRDADTRE